MPIRFRTLLHFPAGAGLPCRPAWLWAALCLVFSGFLRAETVLDIPIHSAGYGTKFFEETARRFERLRPGVRVNLYGDPRMADKVRIRVIGGNYPDATTAELLWPKLIEAGRVLELTPYLDEKNWEGDARWGDTFASGALESWRIGGKVYGLPFVYSCWTLFYNKRLFREQGLTEPRTWDEFFAACEKLRASGVAPVALPGVYLRSYGDAFFRAAYYNLTGSEGWRALNALEPGTRSDPRYVRAAALVQRLSPRYLIAGWEGLTHTGAQRAFLEGRAAMTVSGSWFVNEMKGKIPPGFELGAMNFPVFEDGKAEPTALQTSSEYFFLFSSGDPTRDRLTVDFFRYLTSRENAEAFVRETDSPVAVRGVSASAYSPLMRSTAELIERARDSYSAPPNMLQPPALAQVLTDARFELFSGRLAPEDFGARLEEVVRAENRRRGTPDSVDYRHPLGGALLLGVLAALVLFLFRRPVGKLGKGNVAGDSRPCLRGGSALGFVAPAFACYAFFILLPGLLALGWAFVRWDGLGPMRWAGLFNFKWLLFESDVFWSALGNNLFLVAMPACVVIPLSLALAYLIHTGIRGAGFLRAVLLFPNLLGGIAATLLWMSAYEPNGGLVNAGLVRLGELLGSDWLRHFAGYPWLAPRNLYWSMVPIYIWMACGFNLVLYLAAMEGIDKDLYEAASIDGASRLRQFFSITLPQLRGTIVVSAVFLVIGGLNAFEMVWLLSSQDPIAANHTMGTLLVSTLFKEFDIGRATAVAAVMLILVLAVSSLLLRRGAGEEEP